MSAEAAFGPEQFAELTGVSRETLSRLKTYVAMLEDWSARHNLVSRATLADVWQRHLWDSAQIVDLIPVGTKSIIDLGTGAGFPGLVIAELLRDRHPRIALYEATRKKCAFLDAVAQRLDLKVEVRCARIEGAVREPFDIVTARALAPLSELLSYAVRFFGRGTFGLVFKGQNVDAELTEAHKSWKMTVKKHPSRSDARGVIVEIRELARVPTP